MLANGVKDRRCRPVRGKPNMLDHLRERPELHGFARLLSDHLVLSLDFDEDHSTNQDRGAEYPDGQQRAIEPG